MRAVDHRADDSPIEEQLAFDVWDASPDALLLVGADGVVLAANDEAILLFGYEADDLVGHPVEQLVPDEIAAAHVGLRAGFAEAPRRRPMGAGVRLSARTAGGGSLPVHVSLAPLPGAGEGVTLAAVRDMREAMAVEGRLVESTRRRLLAEDHERIARDLHDTVIQELFALGMTLQATVADVDDQRAAARIDGAVDALDDIIRSIRSLIFDVRNRSGEQTARADIVDIAANMSTLLGFDPRLSFAGPVDATCVGDLHGDVIAVVTEGLANVARHAEATAVGVIVSVADGSLLVEVTDDGVGPPSGDATLSGLKNLDERAVARGGECSLSAHADGGSSLRWRVPLPSMG